LVRLWAQPLVLQSLPENFPPAIWHHHAKNLSSSSATVISRTENEPSRAATRYYAGHREEICAAHEEYRNTHREYTRKYGREYYWRNRKRMLEYGRRYREAKKAHKLAHQG
jgi:hypothetical protein